MSQITYHRLGPADVFPHLVVRTPHRSCYAPGTSEIPVRDPWLTPLLIRNVMQAAQADYAEPVSAVVWYRGPSFEKLTHVAFIVLPPGYGLEITAQRLRCPLKRIAA